MFYFTRYHEHLKSKEFNQRDLQLAHEKAESIQKVPWACVRLCPACQRGRDRQGPSSAWWWLGPWRPFLWGRWWVCLWETGCSTTADGPLRALEITREG